MPARYYCKEMVDLFIIVLRPNTREERCMIRSDITGPGLSTVFFVVVSEFINQLANINDINIIFKY